MVGVCYFTNKCSQLPQLTFIFFLARLDADGNEIPSEEEEEIERLRAESRVRAQNRPRTYVTAPTPGVEVRPSLNNLHAFIPDTRTATSPDEDLDFDHDDNPPRVHLGPHDPRVFYGSAPGVQQHASTSRTSRTQPNVSDQKHIPPSRPFYVNPLPMPLEEMVQVRKPSKNDRSRVIRLSEHTIFAGR